MSNFVLTIMEISKKKKNVLSIYIKIDYCFDTI